MNPDLHAEYSMFCYPVPLRVKICYLFSYRYFHHYLYLCFDVAQVRRSQKLFPFPKALKRCVMPVIKMTQMLHQWVSCFPPHTHVKPAILLHSISISHSFVPSLPPLLPPFLPRRPLTCKRYHTCYKSCTDQQIPCFLPPVHTQNQ